MRKLFNRPQAESEELLELRAIVAAVHLSQAVIEFDLDGVVLDANANFLAVLGYELSEIKGRHHRMFVDPAEAGSPAYAEFWKRLNAGEFVADKFVRYGKNGKRAVIEVILGIADAISVHRFDRESILLGENSAAALVRYSLTPANSNTPISVRMAYFTQFKGGKLTSLRAVIDTFDLVEQTLGRQIHLPKIA